MWPALQGHSFLLRKQILARKIRYTREASGQGQTFIGVGCREPSLETAFAVAVMEHKRALSGSQAGLPWSECLSYCLPEWSMPWVLGSWNLAAGPQHRLWSGARAGLSVVSWLRSWFFHKNGKGIPTSWRMMTWITGYNDPAFSAHSRLKRPEFIWVS